jgi:hypothetical protein
MQQAREQRIASFDRETPMTTHGTSPAEPRFAYSHAQTTNAPGAQQVGRRQDIWLRRKGSLWPRAGLQPAPPLPPRARSRRCPWPDLPLGPRAPLRSSHQDQSLREGVRIFVTNIKHCKGAARKQHTNNRHTELCGHDDGRAMPDRIAV